MNESEQNLRVEYVPRGEEDLVEVRVTPIRPRAETFGPPARRGTGSELDKNKPSPPLSAAGVSHGRDDRRDPAALFHAVLRPVKAA